MHSETLLTAVLLAAVLLTSNKQPLLRCKPAVLYPVYTHIYPDYFNFAGIFIVMAAHLSTWGYQMVILAFCCILPELPNL